MCIFQFMQKIREGKVSQEDAQKIWGLFMGNETRGSKPLTEKILEDEMNKIGNEWKKQ